MLTAVLAGGAAKENPDVPIVGTDVVAGVDKVKKEEVGAVVAVDAGVDWGKREGVGAVAVGVGPNANADGAALVALVVVVVAAVENAGKVLVGLAGEGAANVKPPVA